LVFLHCCLCVHVCQAIVCELDQHHSMLIQSSYIPMALPLSACISIKFCIVNFFRIFLYVSVIYVICVPRSKFCLTLLYAKNLYVPCNLVSRLFMTFSIPITNSFIYIYIYIHTHTHTHTLKRTYPCV